MKDIYQRRAPLPRRIRRDVRKGLSRAVAGLLGRRASQESIDPTAVHKILLCRINARLGNMLFLSPLLQALAEVLPHAQVDLLVTYPGAQELFRGLGNVRHVWSHPPNRQPGPWRRWKLLRDIRREQYDLAIDPCIASTSGRVALSTSGARWKLGFDGDEQWAPLTHAVKKPKRPRHQAIRPVFLLQGPFDYRFEPGSVRLSIALSEEELEEGRRALAGVAGPERRFGFFAHADQRKRIPTEWWRKFLEELQRLEPEVQPVELLPLEDAEPLDPRWPGLYLGSPRQMAAAMTHLDGFVSGDTGPMHLASASRAPTTALFRASKAHCYRPLKPSDLTLQMDEVSPESAAAQCRSRWFAEQRVEER